MKKIKKAALAFLSMLPYLVIGGICGLSFISYFEAVEKSGSEVPHILLWSILLLGIYLAIYLQIIIHESGHLIFGLMTGYHFGSFRIASFMWIKLDGRIRLKRHSLAGTVGQCIMSPPVLVDGKIPFVLYNMGGSIMNLITALLSFALRFVIPEWNIFSPLLFLMGMIGLLFALMNGLPLKLGAVNNDGHNALSMGKDDAALRAFWLQMKIAERVAAGLRLRDMPEEWFVFPADADMNNSMIAAVEVFRCNRLMDEMRFEEAEEAMSKLTRGKNGVLGVHKSLLICDRIYLAILLDRGDDAVKAMLTEEQMQFMRAMKTFPSVIRTEYALAVGYYRDEKAAQKKLEEFEKIAKRYPYESDIESDRELMNLKLTKGEIQ